MDILTHTVYEFFRPRQHKIARFTEEAEPIQKQQLRWLWRMASHTEWGVQHDFEQRTMK